MAEYDSSNKAAEQVETTDRGLFGFGKKEKEDESLSSEFAEKTHVSEPSSYKVEKEDERDEKKKLHRSDSSSSSSSSEEEGEDGVRKVKKDKKKKDKVKEEDKKDKYEDTHVKIEKYDDEEKKGIVDKIKEKLPGGHKKTEDVEIAVAPSSKPAEHVEKVEEKEEKKGFLEKIKEKLPGFHAKTEGDDHKEIKD